MIPENPLLGRQTNMDSKRTGIYSQQQSMDRQLFDTYHIPDIILCAASTLVNKTKSHSSHSRRTNNKVCGNK